MVEVARWSDYAWTLQHAAVDGAARDVAARVAELGAKVDDLIDRSPAVADDSTLAGLARAVDDLAARVRALESRAA